MNKKWFFLVVVLFVLGGCFGPNKSDIKNSFCGVGIDARYCKCAFHNEYCDSIGMSKGEAKEHVYDKYAEYQNPDIGKKEEECAAKNGYFYGRTCTICDHGDVPQGLSCVPVDEATEDDTEDETEEVEEESEEEVATESECKFDSDCPATCEGDVMWKRGCNARTNTCEKTFDTNCSATGDTYGGMSFLQICSAGACVSDRSAIAQKKTELEQTKQSASDEVKAINAKRLELKDLMLDANKNCINSIADMTNVAILEFATRTGSVMAGGFPDLASASVDYVSDALNKIFASADEATPEDQKLKPHEYIKLHCDLYTHFTSLLASTDKELEDALEKSRVADEQLKLLP